jgi:phosphoenolpyruvate carboxykinase (GTP)
MGATVSSEQTAAAEGTVGQLRRDPFAMLPFCGYNMADYFAHWLEVGQRLGEQAPAVFQVNWFRKQDGEFLWPGFGDNARVIDWILRRLDGAAEAVDAPIGFVPTPDSLNTEGLELDPEALQALLTVNPHEWRAELDSAEHYLNTFGDALPAGLRSELASLRYRTRD